MVNENGLAAIAVMQMKILRETYFKWFIERRVVGLILDTGIGFMLTVGIIFEVITYG
jgi:hypothetical protein